MEPTTQTRRYSSFVLLSVVLVLFLVGSLALMSMTSVASDPVQAAWNKAQATGSYRFNGTIAQVTTPAATLRNVGRTSRSQALHMEGTVDVRAQALDMRLWSDGSSQFGGVDGYSIRIADGKTSIRQGQGPWKNSTSAAAGLAPQGDWMAFLHGVRDLAAHPPETRAGLSYTRYSFTTDGPRLALYVRDQIAASLSRQGQLPAGTKLTVPSQFNDMVGGGEIWVSQDGLPLRELLKLDFPAERDEYVHADIAINFVQFGVPGMSGPRTVLGTITAYLPQSRDVAVLIVGGGLVVLLIRSRRRRSLQAAAVLVVCVSLTVGPLLQAIKLDTFNRTQIARAAEHNAAQSEQDMLRQLQSIDAQNQTDPHESPFAAADRAQAQMHAGHVLPATTSSAAAPVPAADILTSDSGLDTDRDGLTDYQEQRIGTNAAVADPDGDRVSDSVEARGSIYGGKTWYLNPLQADSNNDGVADGLEWDLNADNCRTIWIVMVSPTLFDADNDNDGVPDRLDLAADSQTPRASSPVFNANNPFKLSLTNFDANKPTFVDFQVRPKDPSTLNSPITSSIGPKIIRDRSRTSINRRSRT